MEGRIVTDIKDGKTVNFWDVVQFGLNSLTVTISSKGMVTSAGATIDNVNGLNELRVSKSAVGGSDQFIKMELQFFASGKNSKGGSNSNTKTFYQVASNENAINIMETGSLTGKEFKEVYAWTEQPTLKQAKISGARSIETVISFEAHPNIFIKDQTVVKNLQSTARVSTRPGPITVNNVKKEDLRKSGAILE